MQRDIELTVYDDRYLGNEATPVCATVRYDISQDRAILERESKLAGLSCQSYAC